MVTGKTRVHPKGPFKHTRRSWHANDSQMTEELETSLIVGTKIRLKSLFVDLQLACRLLVS